MINLVVGIGIPFLGTFLGSLLVFFLKDNFSLKVERVLFGIASGIMMSAAIWSLLCPSIQLCTQSGKIAWLAPSIGFLIGTLFLPALEMLIMFFRSSKSSKNNYFKKTFIMILAVILHNIPEGLAVGVALSAADLNSNNLSILGALGLSIGIAIQNFPEGAIISLPLRASGMSKAKSFFLGVISGVVELLFAVMAVFFTKLFVPLLPYILSFASGTMIFVVVDELIPDLKGEENFLFPTICVAIGFVLMMILDIGLG